MIPPRITAAGLVLIAPLWARVTESPAPPAPALVTIPGAVCHGDFAGPVPRAPVLEQIPCGRLPDPRVRADQWQLYLAGVLHENDLVQEYPGVLIVGNWDAAAGHTVLSWTTERRECAAGRITRWSWYTPDPLQEWTHDLWGDGSDITISVTPGAILTVEVLAADGLARTGLRFDPCDLNLDGWHDAADLVVYLTAPYDWNGDGAVDSRDVADLVACLGR